MLRNIRSIRKASRMLWGAACCALALGAVSGCGTADGGSSSGTIKVGLVAPFTGSLAVYGEALTDTLEAYIDQHPEVAGRSFELISEDGQGDPGVAATKIQKLVEQDGIDFLVGPVSSAAALATVDYIQNNQVPTVQPVAFTKDLTAPDTASDYIFRTIDTTDQSGYTIGRWAFEKQGYKTVALVGSDYAAGHDGVEAFKAGFEDAGGKVVAEAYPPMGTKDFVPFLSDLSGKSADAAYAVVFGEDAIGLVRQWQELGLKDKIPLITYGTSTDEFVLGAMGEAALGVANVSPYVSTIDNPENAKLKQALKGTTQYPLIVHATAWTGMQLITAAVEQLDGDLSDPEAVANAMRESGASLASPMGEVSFDEQGQIIVPEYVRDIRDVDGEPHAALVDELGTVSQADAWGWWQGGESDG